MLSPAFSQRLADDRLAPAFVSVSGPDRLTSYFFLSAVGRSRGANFFSFLPSPAPKAKICLLYVPLFSCLFPILGVPRVPHFLLSTYTTTKEGPLHEKDGEAAQGSLREEGLYSDFSLLSFPLSSFVASFGEMSL